MKKVFASSILTVLFCAGLVGCSTDNDDNSTGNGSTNESVTETSGTDVDDFSITFDTSALSESETIPTDANDETYEDYVETETFNNVFTITYTDNDVTWTGEDDDITLTKSGAHLTVNATKKGRYILQGSSSNGSFKIYSEKKFQVELNGVTLTNPTGAAINSQSKKRMYLTTTSGTTATLSDGSSYSTTDGEDEKGTLFSEGQIVFNGTGLLQVSSYGKNAIVSDQYIRIRKNTNISIPTCANHGIKADDYIVVDGGVQNISISAAGGKGFKVDGYLTMNGGRTTVITSGGVDTSDSSDLSSCAGVKTDSTFTINGGELRLKSTGQGGKGINSDQEIYLNGGTVLVNTTGSKYGSSSSSNGGFTPGGGPGMRNTRATDSSSSPKGIKSDLAITVNGGTVKVRCEGSGGECIESKQSTTSPALLFNGGEVYALSYSDDALNATGIIKAAGGKAYAYSKGNDAIDSNYGKSGAVTVTAGLLAGISSAGSPEEGIDCDNASYITITGGYLICVGGIQNNTSSLSSATTQGYYLSTSKNGFDTSKYYTLSNGSGTNYMAFKLPASINSALTILSAPGMTSKGSSYSFSSSTSTPSGTGWYNIYMY